MRTFDPANALLADNAALRARFQEDGFLFFRGVLAPSKLLRIRRQIVNICARQRWFKPATDPMEAMVWTSAKVEGEDDYFAVYDEIQKLEDFHALPHDSAVLDIMRGVLDDTAFPHPLAIARLSFPGIPEWSTPPHQDYPNNQGTQDLYACWIPLSDCPIALGGLSVLRGSHRFGVLPLEFALGPGHRQAMLPPEMAALEWQTVDYQLGDLIVFHSLTVHRALPNHTDRLRLSVDYRFQRENEPVTDICLRPHFSRLRWDDIYHDWRSDKLKYYWHDKTFTRSEWDSSLQALPDSHLHEAVRARHVFDKKRAQMQGCYDRGVRPDYGSPDHHH